MIADIHTYILHNIIQNIGIKVLIFPVQMNKYRQQCLKTNIKSVGAYLVYDVIENFETLFYIEINSLWNSIGHIYYQELILFFTATQLSELEHIIVQVTSQFIFLFQARRVLPPLKTYKRFNSYRKQLHRVEN